MANLPALVASAVRGALGISALLGAAACNVDVLPEKPAVANTCKEDSDCGVNGVCTAGACYSKTGAIDEVLLEIVPEASSPLNGTSFFSMQEGLRRGAPSRAITLAGPLTFATQVMVNGEDLAGQDCPYLGVGKQSIAARVQFTRVGVVSGLPVAGLSSGSTLTVTTEQNTAPSMTGFSKSVSLVPGFYDVYAQPIGSTNCQIPAKVWRGVDFARDGQIVGWAPPVTLELPAPLTLNGRVTRMGGTLTNWQIEIIDPEEGKVVSTTARLGDTQTSPFTNFKVSYQPPEYVMNANGAKPSTANNLLLRLKPPKELESTSPTVYFDLGGAAGTGQINLDVSKLPTSMQMVTVAGQVRDGSDGVKATVKFFNLTLSKVQGLPASFGPAVTTDGAGRYSTRLFPGDYRIVVVPEGATDDGSAGANPTRQWALTEQEVTTITTDTTQNLDLGVNRTRVIAGVATAGASHVPAQGATLEANPLIVSSSDVLNTVTSPSSTPAKASASIDDKTGGFSLVVDPGDYDFALKPAASSNFAWWVLPSITVDKMETGRTISPELLYPVPFAGTMVVTTQDMGPQPLRNATVRAYALTPLGDSVTQVGTTRTDDMGRYQVALPPAWGSLP